MRRSDTLPSPVWTLQTIERRLTPAAPRVVHAWLCAHASAAELIVLARQYLEPVHAMRVERELTAGRHGEAAERFCRVFSRRCFPLEYPWTGAYDGRFLVELVSGIHHAGYGDEWEQLGDIWSLRLVFVLSWSLMEDPYGPLRDEFFQDEMGNDHTEVGDRLLDEARACVAHAAQVDAEKLFAGIPVDGFSFNVLQARLNGTLWEPLVWAAPWLWRLSGNPFLDQAADDDPDPVAWSPSTVFELSRAHREAVRVMRAIDSLDQWLCRAPAERIPAAVQAALARPADRVSKLADLPILGGHHAAPQPIPAA
jgi:hypothetical protein